MKLHDIFRYSQELRIPSKKSACKKVLVFSEKKKILNLFLQVEYLYNCADADINIVDKNKSRQHYRAHTAWNMQDVEYILHDNNALLLF